MSKNFCLIASRMVLLIGIGMVSIWAELSHAGRLTLRFDGVQTHVLSTSPEIDTTWRHTKYGWQDSARWPVADAFTPSKTVELLHPIVWAAIVLLSVVTSTIWASNEWETARLFRSDSDSNAGT